MRVIPTTTPGITARDLSKSLNGSLVYSLTMAMMFGDITPTTVNDVCAICGFRAAVKVHFKQGNLVTFCDIHAFVNSDIIWKNAQAVYDRVDVLPPREELDN